MCFYNKIMKYFLTILISLFFSAISAENTKEYITTGSDDTKIKSFELENNKKFSSFSSNGSWTDNYGNYGFTKCMGIINKNSKNVELYFMCESEDKNGYKTWSLNKRQGELGSGIGFFEIVDTTIPKKELYVGTKCTYAVKYLKETNFYKSKCKISEELSRIFEKIGSGK